jgi:hypothetical protein
MAQRTRTKKPPKQKPPKVPNCVLVTVEDTKDGRTLQVGTTGNIKMTEAPTLLRLAAKQAEQQLGLE